MVFASFVTAAAFALNAVSAQVSFGQNVDTLTATTTIPIAFTRSVDANHAHAGDPVMAKTTQIVTLASGKLIPAGAQVVGHVVTGVPFVFDSTPYARQKQAELAIHFDSIVDAHGHAQPIPLSVYVRALADPVTSSDARTPATLDGTLTTMTQIGGDQRAPSQAEILSRDGDVVGYQRRGGAFAHLIAARGNSPDGCDAADTEQPVSIFSASACGLYGFTGVSLIDSGRRAANGTFVLESHRLAPRIWANSNALLEVTVPETPVASR